MVGEAALLPWVMAEAARLRTPPAVVVQEGSESERDALRGRRRRVIDNYEDGVIDKAERDAKLVATDSALERLDIVERAILVPELDWTWPAERINVVLRSIWSHVQLDDHVRPIDASWLVPEWRADAA